MYRMYDNKGLERLPYIPDNVEFLYCNNNKLKELPNNLPNNLIGLHCNNNLLKKLPNLPNILLSNLQCANNQLETLPDLPDTLWKLGCENNQLKTLPDLPNNLEELNCANNQLKTLPNLSNNLEVLNCANNQIEELPILPKLKNFTVSFDQFHLVKPVINNKYIIVTVIDSNNSSMDDIVKYNKQWKTIIDDYRRKIKFNLPNTRERFNGYANARLSLFPPTTENPLTGKVHRVGKKSSGKKSSGKNSADKNSAVDTVAANLDKEILSYLGGSSRKMKSRKIRKNNKTLRSK